MRSYTVRPLNSTQRKIEHSWSDQNIKKALEQGRTNVWKEWGLQYYKQVLLTLENRKGKRESKCVCVWECVKNQVQTSQRLCLCKSFLPTSWLPSDGPCVSHRQGRTLWSRARGISHSPLPTLHTQLSTGLANVRKAGQMT